MQRRLSQVYTNNLFKNTPKIYIHLASTLSVGYQRPKSYRTWEESMGMAKNWDQHEYDEDLGECSLCYEGFPIECPQCGELLHGKPLPDSLWAHCQDCNTKLDITEIAKFKDGELKDAALKEIERLLSEPPNND
jgi:hypothetical protein